MKYSEKKKGIPCIYIYMNANLKAVFAFFIDKSLLKCLVVNDNVNNVIL